MQCPLGRSKISKKTNKIIAQITHYDLRLLKASKDLRKVTGIKKLAFNYNLIETLNKVAYQASPLVKALRAKSTFIWLGKSFVVGHNDYKH